MFDARARVVATPMSRRLRATLYLALGSAATLLASAALMAAPSSGAQRIVGVTPIPYLPPIPLLPPIGLAVQNTSCPSSNACTWIQSDYGGARDVLDGSLAGTWFSFSERRRSAKNRFDSRKFKLGRVTGSGITVLTCMDPGDNRSDPGYFDAFYVSDSTTDQCG